MTPPAGIGSPVRGAVALSGPPLLRLAPPCGRVVPPRIIRTTHRLQPRAPISSSCRATILQAAIAWSGDRAFGPGCSPAGTGSPRWIRRPDGWEFRDGYWVPDPDTAVITTNTRRRVVARPGPSGLPPAIIDSERGPGDTDVGTDSLPPPPGAVTGQDFIAESEASGRLIGPGEVPVVVGPVTGMPYYVIRPPGTYPYGPQGVVVPGAVPPFVRRILDRVLP